MDDFSQLNMFDELPKFKITKPIKLIELFAGIGSQAKSLERLGVEFEHYRVCEFDPYAITSYNAIHNTNFATSDIKKWKGKDLGIVDTKNFNYILTYSFPCQNLSICGKKEGMIEDSGTHSSLIWEVKRLLIETEKLPQILIMENVPQILSDKNKLEFFKWIEFLKSLGYQSEWKILNSKNFGVPQSRERCFMVSCLGNFEYKFPHPRELKKSLKDLLQPHQEIDDKYYVNKKDFRYVEVQKDNNTNNPILVGGFGEKKSNGGTQWYQQDRVYSADGIAMCHPVSISGGSYLYFIKDYDENKSIIRKLTQKECFRLMDFDDDDYEKARKALNEKFYKGKDKSGSQLYKQAGNSIVVSVLEAIFKEMM